MPRKDLQFPANGEKPALWAAIAVALGHGDTERTRTLIEGFDSELAGVKLEANVLLNELCLNLGDDCRERAAYRGG